MTIKVNLGLDLLIFTPMHVHSGVWIVNCLVIRVSATYHWILHRLFPATQTQSQLCPSRNGALTFHRGRHCILVSLYCDWSHVSAMLALYALLLSSKPPTPLPYLITHQSPYRTHNKSIVSPIHQCTTSQGQKAHCLSPDYDIFQVVSSVMDHDNLRVEPEQIQYTKTDPKIITGRKSSTVIDQLGAIFTCSQHKSNPYTQTYSLPPGCGASVIFQGIAITIILALADCKSSHCVHLIRSYK